MQLLLLLPPPPGLMGLAVEGSGGSKEPSSPLSRALGRADVVGSVGSIF